MMTGERQQLIEAYLNLWKDREWLNTTEVALLIGKSKTKVDLLVKDDKIPSHKDGGKRLFKKEEIISWIYSYEDTPKPKGGARRGTSRNSLIPDNPEWEKIVSNAANTFSKGQQIIKLLNRMSRIQNSLTSCLSEENDFKTKNIHEEIAEVYILLAQMCVYFDPTGVVKNRIQSKIENLANEIQNKRLLNDNNVV